MDNSITFWENLNKTQDRRATAAINKYKKAVSAINAKAMGWRERTLTNEESDSITDRIVEMEDALLELVLLRVESEALQVIRWVVEDEGLPKLDSAFAQPSLIDVEAHDNFLNRLSRVVQRELQKTIIEAS